MTKFRLLLLVLLAAHGVNGWAQCRAAVPDILNGPQRFAATSPTSSESFSFADRGAVTFDTTGEGGGPTLGYARIQPNGGSTSPGAYLTFQFRKDGVLVGQASVPAMTPIQSGRIY